MISTINGKDLKMGIGRTAPQHMRCIPMKKLSGLEWIVTILVVVGASNWGLLAINPGWNVVLNLFGEGTLAKTSVRPCWTI